ncbi:cytochrome P450 [Streptomyces ipomoeae]|uniref:Unspecific monooxygenase n=1 Tax=Streptomyces ipomoeae 91-03 TaxID=698759 RepID=L1L9K7_9ACTN|nr:cytochrome P450 [Streptomyces ipomoeae]EKX69469.1 unspecific monooxygenase [Streptomyces ipomoeae 91-03]MDX2699932.1 cytochrome P450 [Streptomyces ipomoeae]MDX2846451.1 cytochrome P450 [Streptomyces ipomoeae]
MSQLEEREHVVRLPMATPGPLDPPAEWERLRERCPVATVELPSGDRAKYVSRYADVRALLADPRFARPRAGEDTARISADGAGGVAADADPEYALAVPEHGEPHLRWRRQVGRYFTAKRMAALRPGMTETAEALVDAMVERGVPGDLKAALGFPLPVYVICELLGAPAEDRDRFSHWSDAFLNVSRFTQEETRAAHTEFAEYMSALVAAKRAEPGDDLLSMLIVESAEHPEEERLTNAELVATGMGLLVAGHETTANMIGKMVALLLADRTHWERLLADPSLIRTAVEEVLRFDANLGGFGIRRYLSEDVDVDGEVLPSGTTVFCAMSSANRDERVFAGADHMDLTRSPNPHITFGAGPHSCLGQALARTELQVVLEVLLRKLPTLELAVPADELRKVEGLLVGGLREVPVRW